MLVQTGGQLFTKMVAHGCVRDSNELPLWVFQVQSYLGHLDGMHISIKQFRDTKVGKSVRKISKWALEPTSKDAAAHAKCAPAPASLYFSLCSASSMAIQNKAQWAHTKCKQVVHVRACDVVNSEALSVPYRRLCNL